MERNIYAFEVKDASIIDEKRVSFIIEKNPYELVGSYFENGNVSYPYKNMLIKDLLNGSLFLVDYVDKNIPFEHKVEARLNKGKMPDMQNGNVFLGAGSVRVDENELR